MSASSVKKGIPNCVSLDSSEPAFLQYEVVQEDGHANVTLDAGTLLWWFQPNWTSATNGGGPGAWAPLIEVGRWSSNFEYGCFAISIDPGGTNIYVEGQTNGAGAVYLQAPIHWNEGEWHQIAVTYDTNSALYIDGVLAANGPAITYRPSASECAQDGLFIGSEVTGTLQARGQFESMRTLNYAMPADCIQGNYFYTVARYWPLQSGSSAMAPSTDSGNGGLNSPLPMDAGGDSSGGLTLGITFGTNQGTFVLTLYGTQAGNIYQVLTNTDVASLNWQVLTNVMGSTNPISFTISNGASAVFFKAKLRQPENGAVWLTLADGHSSISAIVNGATINYSNFCSTVVEKRRGRIGTYLIPPCVANVGSYAFAESHLNNIVIPDTVAKIGSYGFWACFNLTNMVIPGSVTYIDDCGFGYLSDTTGFFFKGNPPQLGLTVFGGHKAATAYYLTSASGWEATFGGLPTCLWNPALQVERPQTKG